MHLSVSACLCVPVCPCVGGHLAILVTNSTQPFVAMRAMTLRVSCAQEEHTAWPLPRVPRLGEGAAEERADLSCLTFPDMSQNLKTDQEEGLGDALAQYDMGSCNMTH